MFESLSPSLTVNSTRFDVAGLVELELYLTLRSACTRAGQG